MRILILICIILTACSESQSYLPKPRVYPLVEYPEKSYTNYQNEDCPFSMDVADYMRYQKDSLKNADEVKFNCWFDLYCQELNTYIHFSYVSFEGRAQFDELVSDAFEMADKHNIKANYRDEIKINYPDRRLYGLLFEIDGPVASPMQFYLTDSTSHFLRGSLYFKGTVNRDSIQPVYDFIKSDIEPMMESFEWQ